MKQKQQGHLSGSRKTILLNSTPFHNRNIQQTRNRKELPQLTKVIYKKPTANNS